MCFEMAYEFFNKMFLVCMEYLAVVFLMHNKFIDNYSRARVWYEHIILIWVQTQDPL